MTIRSTLLCLLTSIIPIAAYSDFVPQPNPRIKLMEGIGHLHHPVNTKNEEAQKYFDQGLMLTYGFNHEAAYWSFQKAAELDPNLAMAYWGMALDLGVNLNKGITPEEMKKAYDLVQKALELAPNTTKAEQDYINALAKRYSTEEKTNTEVLSRQYANAMKQLSETYPDDLDAATLYAESMMDLHPWKMWTLDGKPREGAIEAVEALQSVMLRNPTHIGANHYYIHSMEASPHPEFALMSAHRLRKLAPNAGHLVHMPAHIFFLVGDYHLASQVNEEAVKADLAYIKDYGLEGNYPVHYLGHNYDFLTRAYSMEGRYNDAMKSSKALSELSTPHYDRFHDLEFRMIVPSLYVLLRFHKWNEILEFPKPDAKLKMTTAMWLASRGIAYAGLGNVSKAEEEKKAFLRATEQLPTDSTFGLNNVHKIMKMMEYVLDARIAQAQDQDQKALDFLQKAVAEEDSLDYDDPPDWYYPIRESLGGLLLKEQRYQEAEKVFRQSLVKHPRNGRALFGLLESLKGQKRDYELHWIEEEYKKAWKYADQPLTLNDLW